MKKLISLVAVLAISIATIGIYAQEKVTGISRAEKEEQKKADRTLKKAEELAAQQAAYQDAVAALKEHKFVLEADRVIFRNGWIAYVNSSTNFVLMNNDHTTVQVAFNTTYPGPNGIGGVTVDGSTSNVKMKTDKKGNISFTFNAQGVGISAQIFITLRTGSDNAEVTISPNFSSNRMSFSGKVIPLDLSNIFKGRSW